MRYEVYSRYIEEVKMATAVKKVSNATTIRFDDDYTRQVIDMAAGLLNQTRAGFLLSVARERAESVIRIHPRKQGNAYKIPIPLGQGG
jgi:hypothetical protein